MSRRMSRWVVQRLIAQLKKPKEDIPLWASAMSRRNILSLCVDSKKLGFPR